jgi:hypothetical protein
LQRFGYHEKPTRLVLTFSSALDPSRAQDAQNYTLTPIGKNGHVGKRIRIASAVYATVADTVTLHFAKLLYLFQRYKLVVNGTAPSGLASSSGILLDGQGNGNPGSDYVKTFGPSILAGPHPPFPGAARSVTPHSKSAHTHSSIKEHGSHHSAWATRRERMHAAHTKADSSPLRSDAVDAVLGTLVSSRMSQNRGRAE